MANSIKDKILQTDRVFDGKRNHNIGEDVDTIDQFYILSATEIGELPATLKAISATDYAVANQASVVLSHKCANGKAATVYWTDSYYFENGKKKVKLVGTKGTASNVSSPNLTRPALAPSFSVSVHDLQNSNAIINTSGLYPTVIFPDMQYPQTKVGGDLAIELENHFLIDKPKPSGWYMGSTTYDKNWLSDEKDYEYTYNGKKYVRVVAESKGTRDMNFFSDGSTCKDGEIYWFKVEPIKWAITNWDSTSLNPNAKNAEDIVNLRTEEAIIGGIPFFTEDSAEINNNLWQNSYIRAFLNSYNIRKVLAEGNGNKNISARKNYDFSTDGSGAFLQVVFKENLPASTNQKEKRTPFSLSVSSKPKSVEEQLKFYIENGLSFMLHGRSGIGKTRRVQEIDPNCVGITLRDGMLPEEITGKTAYNDMTGKACWIEPPWYTKICQICSDDPEHYHVLFIDELTNTRATEQSLAYNLILEHAIEIGRGELPKNCVVVAAGNSPEESDSAYYMTEPLFRRFVAHIYLKPDLMSFINWGGKPNRDFPERPNIHPAVLSFIASRGLKALFSDYESEKPPEYAIDPRGWEHVSDILYASKGEICANLIVNKTGPDLAVDFLNFIQKPQITLDDIINDDVNMDLMPKGLEEKYAHILSLIWVDEDHVDKVRNFIKTNIGGEFLSYFDSAWAGNNVDRLLCLDEYVAEELKNSF